MEKQKKVIVIGAGPGGLATSMLLSSTGFDVTVYEKQPYIGGRTSKIQLGDYSFDMGPTFFMMPQLLEELFQAVGRKLHDYVEMKEVDPLYTLKFKDQTFTPSRDRKKMLIELEKVFPGNQEGYLRFMKKEEKKFDRVAKLLLQPFNTLKSYVSKDVFAALPVLDAQTTVYKKLSTYFNTEQLRWAFSFQSKYLGMSAWECPGTFTILSYLEHRYGLFHTIGGINQLCQAMADVTEEYGGRIVTNQGIQKILVEQGKAIGVVLENGEQVYADDVVINGDFGHAVTTLFEQSDLKKYKKENIKKKKLSCSTFMMYLGINKKLDIPHHMVLFSEDYQENVDDMTKKMVLSTDCSIYVHNPSVIDPTLAPEGKSSLFILLPVPNLQADIDWEKEQENIREQILTRLEREPELKNLRNYIEEEKIISPLNWQNDQLVYKGATFNLAHSLDQMMYLRPHNQFDDVKHCFLVGGGTHPGSGLPTIFASAKISTELLMEQYKAEPSMEMKVSKMPKGEYVVWK